MEDSLTCGLVLTTINDPVLLEEYFENFKEYGHLEQVKAYAIFDKKTPVAAYQRCRNLLNRGFNIHAPSLEEQETYLKKLGKLNKLIPYNSDNRRNIGFLMALEANVDFIISIDDDNYCKLDEDFFGEHSVVVSNSHSFEVISSHNGWFNMCEMLTLQPDYRIYPRGFPYHSRHKESKINKKIETGLIRMNAGLWLGDPDLDAMTWIVAPVKACSFSGRSVVLHQDTWSPINTQNTALHRALIPCYYYIKMGYPLSGINIDRYGDIFSGYFSQVVMRHMGHYVRIGTPISDHRRNSHNYLKDAYSELICFWILEDITGWLKEVQLEGNTYEDAYISLSYKLEDAVEDFSGKIWTDSTKGYFHQIAYCMREWVRSCKTITAT